MSLPLGTSPTPRAQDSKMSSGRISAPTGPSAGRPHSGHSLHCRSWWPCQTFLALNPKARKDVLCLSQFHPSFLSRENSSLSSYVYSLPPSSLCQSPGLDTDLVPGPEPAEREVGHVQVPGAQHRTCRPCDTLGAGRFLCVVRAIIYLFFREGWGIVHCVVSSIMV